MQIAVNAKTQYLHLKNVCRNLSYEAHGAAWLTDCLGDANVLAAGGQKFVAYCAEISLTLLGVCMIGNLYTAGALVYPFSMEISRLKVPCSSSVRLPST